LWAGLFGLLLGGFYFGLLWLTVRHLATLRWPATWVLVSLMVRMGGLLAGLYWIGAGSWKLLVAALLGVIIVRVVFTRYLRPVASASQKNHFGKG